MTVNRIVIVPYDAADMYALVDDIDAYPQFLPWCTEAHVHRDGERVEATLFINYRGIRTSFATINQHTPEKICMRLKSGPLSALTGSWQFVNLGDHRCRVELNLHYAFQNRIMSGMFSGIFSIIFDRFVDHFLEQAKKTYGSAGRGNIEVELIHSDNHTPIKRLILPGGATIADALVAGNIQNPERVGIFGQQYPPTKTLTHGDRVEIYRSLPNDPRIARRQRLR